MKLAVALSAVLSTLLAGSLPGVPASACGQAGFRSLIVLNVLVNPAAVSGLNACGRDPLPAPACVAEAPTANSVRVNPAKPTAPRRQPRTLLVSMLSPSPSAPNARTLR